MHGWRDPGPPPRDRSGEAPHVHVSWGSVKRTRLPVVGSPCTRATCRQRDIGGALGRDPRGTSDQYWSDLASWRVAPRHIRPILVGRGLSGDFTQHPEGPPTTNIGRRCLVAAAHREEANNQYWSEVPGKSTAPRKGRRQTRPNQAKLRRQTTPNDDTANPRPGTATRRHRRDRTRGACAAREAQPDAPVPRPGAPVAQPHEPEARRDAPAAVATPRQWDAESKEFPRSDAPRNATNSRRACGRPGCTPGTDGRPWPRYTACRPAPDCRDGRTPTGPGEESHGRALSSGG